MKRYKGVMVRIGVMLALVAGIASVQAAGERVIASPVSPRDKATYALPAATVASQGLWNVGVGESIHLEAQVPLANTVTGVTWTLTAKPPASLLALDATAILPPVMTAGMPIYDSYYRTVNQVAGRALFIPDAAGIYTIQGTITTTEAGAVNVVVTVSAATYVGVGTTPTVGGTVDAPTVTWTDTAVTPQCGVCHKLDNRIAPWQGTKHATKLARELAGLVSEDSHYSGNCISCHTVGYNKTASANNGGFDDVATLLGWTALDGAGGTTFALTNWNNMDPTLQTLGNIQCENCHGAGSEHGLSQNAQKVAVDYGVGVCASCHDSGSHHVRPAEWLLSKHATRVTTSSSSSCARCHTGSGFVNYATPRFGGQRANVGTETIGCSVCHNPHSNANGHQVRTTADVTLFNGEVIADGEHGKLCMQCHITRRDADAYVDDTYTKRATADVTHYGPHHGPQGDMLAGLNAYQFGKYIPSSAGHLLATEAACATCHMQVLAAGNPAIIGGVQQAGGHTFSMVWNNAGTDVDQTGICAECHGTQPDFDLLTRKDYDGNGVAEGIQTEIENLLEKLASLLPNGGGTPSRTYTKAQFAALYNYLFVEEDRSLGVHNPQYASGVLKASIEALSGATPSGGVLGGETASGGWVKSDWFGYYSPIFDGNWIFHQYHGPLYVNPNASGGFIELWDPVIGTWLFTTPTVYPVLYMWQNNAMVEVTFSRDPADGRRMFTPTGGGSVLDYPGFSFDPAAGINP